MTIRQILAWAEQHQQRTGRWPTTRSGRVIGSKGETWGAIHGALRGGFRGLRGGSSLAKVLATHRKVRAERRAKRLSIARVLAWSDAHRRRTGAWPEVKSGSIPEAPGENWKRIDNALRSGSRALEGGSSLAQLLAERRGKWYRRGRSPLRYSHILEWADAHHKHTGQWPIASSGAVRGVDGESWAGIHGALVHGIRDLPGGDSLGRFLEARRGVRNLRHLPRLTIKQILKWSDAHAKREGFWPTRDAGPVHGVPGETWLSINIALHKGRRGLPGGVTLAGLYSKHRGVRSSQHLPHLQEGRILTWADAHRKRSGWWPTGSSGLVHNAPRETWGAINVSLREGLRGLPGGTSLAQLLGKKRGKRHMHDLPSLSIKRILAWADHYYWLNKSWPQRTSGPIPGTNGETWGTVEYALHGARRGFRWKTSLAKFLNKHRRPEKGL